MIVVIIFIAGAHCRAGLLSRCARAVIIIRRMVSRFLGGGFSVVAVFCGILVVLSRCRRRFCVWVGRILSSGTRGINRHDCCARATMVQCICRNLPRSGTFLTVVMPLSLQARRSTIEKRVWISPIRQEIQNLLSTAVLVEMMEA